MTEYPKRVIEIDLHLSARATREIHPAEPHFHAARLVGATTAGDVLGAELRWPGAASVDLDWQREAQDGLV